MSTAGAQSETLVGEAIKGKRAELVVATKVRLPMSDDNFNRSGTTRVNILRGVESSLRRLQTDYIDLYQVHGWDSNTPLDETLRTLDDLVRQGKVRYIGFSNYMAWQGATALAIQKQEHLEPFVTAQMYYGLVGRDLEHDFIPFAEYSGIGILVWSTLAGGFLSGKYSRGNPLPTGTRFAEAGQFVPFDVERGYEIIEVLKAVAQRHNVSPVTVAVAWTLSRPAISSVIAGAGPMRTCWTASRRRSSNSRQKISASWTRSPIPARPIRGGWSCSWTRPKIPAPRSWSRSALPTAGRGAICVGRSLRRRSVWLHQLWCGCRRVIAID